MEEWMHAQQQNYPQGRNRSYSMSHADNISSFYHQLQQQQQQKPQPQQQAAAFSQPLPHHQPAAMMTDSFLQEGSPLSMSSSSCGSDDVAYSSDYAPQLQSTGTTLHQQNAFEQHPPAHLQRRASLSSTPASGGVGASLGILGGFVGEGLRAEYASRRPGGRRKSICLSPSQQQDEQMNVSDHYQPYTSVPDSEATSESAMDAMAAMRRNSLPASNARRNSLSCPLVHNYTPLTAVPTLGRALAEGNLGQRKSIQSFLSMLAQSSNDRSDKRRKRKSSRKDRGKRYKRSDYDESSDDEDDDSSEEGNNHATTGANPFASPGEHEPSGTPFSGFDYSSGGLVAEGSVSSDSSSDTIPSSAGDQSTPSPFEPITPMGSAELFPPYPAGADAASPSTYGGMGTTRPRSRSSPPSYVDSAQIPLTHQQQLQRQYHIAQTNKRLQELRQQHLERLQRQMEMERQQSQQQRHSYEYPSTTQRYSAQPFQAQPSGYPPQAHVLGLEMSHQARVTGPQLVHHQPSTSASLPSVLPSHDMGPYHQYGPELMHNHHQLQLQPEPLAQELMDPQARADFDFYNEFSDFNMCEPASLESLCRTVPEDGLLVAHQAPGTSIPIGSDQLSTDDGPVSEILVDEFSVVPSSAFAHESWLGAGGASEAAPDASSYPSGLAERKDQPTDDSFSEFFNLDDAGMGASH